MLVYYLWKPKKRLGSLTEHVESCIGNGKGSAGGFKSPEVTGERLRALILRHEPPLTDE